MTKSQKEKEIIESLVVSLNYTIDREGEIDQIAMGHQLRIALKDYAAFIEGEAYKKGYYTCIDERKCGKHHSEDLIRQEVLAELKKQVERLYKDQIELHDGRLPFVIFGGKLNEQEIVTVYRQALKDVLALLSLNQKEDGER